MTRLEADPLGLMEVPGLRLDSTRYSRKLPAGRLVLVERLIATR
jgi:hypothetical protein